MFPEHNRGRLSVRDDRFRCVRTTNRVVQSPHFVIQAVDCAGGHGGWSSPEQTSSTHVVLVRRGRFQLDSQGRRMAVDPTVGYLHKAGAEARFAHPTGGDVCTSVAVSDDSLAAEIGAVRAPAVRVDARLELAHRTLLSARADPDFAAAEAVVRLLQLAVRRQPDETPSPGRYDLADRAREAVLAGEPGAGSLVALAGLLHTSPAHLSRTFRHHVGMSISRYRNRVRVSQALERIGDGETDLAGLAATLGFSDQAHFTRTMQNEVRHTPGRVRDLMAHRGRHPATGDR